MLQDSMPGEARMSNGVSSEVRGRKAASQNAAPPNEAVEEMAEKLERSEAGRRKLRQAISMLKEKIEANEKVLQVNDILRQEVETQRLRAEAETKRAEEERKLREEDKMEGLFTKEQLVHVFQRLDTVERNCKADRDETEKLRKETKVALVGLNGVVRAIEAAHASFDSLEKNLVSKVNNGISASTKSSLLAQTAISAAEGAQGRAATAEKLSQSLVSAVSELKQKCAGLSQRVEILDQELQVRPPFPSVSMSTRNEQTTQMGNFAVPERSSKSGQRKSLPSGSQQQPHLVLSSPNTTGNACLTQCTIVDLKAGRTEVTINAADRDGVAGFGSRGAKQDGMPYTAENSGARTASGAKVQERPSADHCATSPSGRKDRERLEERSSEPAKSLPNSSRIASVAEALKAAKNRKLLTALSSGENLQRPAIAPRCQSTSVSALGPTETSFSKTAEEIAHVGAQIKPDHDIISIAAVVGKEGKQVHENGTPSLRNGPSNFGFLKLRTPKGAEEDGVIVHPSQSRENERSEKIICDHEISTMDQSKEGLPALLLRDIMTLYQKGKKSHEKMGKKLATLEKVLETDFRNEGCKRRLDCSDEKSTRKRKKLNENNKEARVGDAERRRLNSTIISADKVSSQGCPSSEQQDKVDKVEASIQERRKITIGKDPNCPVRLPSPESYSPHRIREYDAGQDGKNCSQGKKSVECAGLSDGSAEDRRASRPSRTLDDLNSAFPELLNADIYAEALSAGQMKGGWDTDSEFSEDELDDGWWKTKRALLSPTLPVVLPPVSEASESLDPSSLPNAADMDPEKIDRFLSVLPRIEQEACDEGGQEALDQGGQESSDQGHQELSDQSTVQAIPTSFDYSKSEVNDLRLQSAGCHVQEVVRVAGGDALNSRFHSKSEPLNSPHPCSASSGGWSSVDCLDDVLKPLSKPSDCKRETKELVMEECPVFNQSESCSLGPVSSVGLVQDADDKTLHICSDRLSAVDSRAGGVDALGEDGSALKQEVLGAVRSASVELSENSFSPNCLDLVFGELGAEVGIRRASASTVQDRSLPSASERSNEIFTAFGRTQKIIKSINYTACSAFGSGLAVAAGIASVLVSSKFSKLDLLCIFTSSLVDSFVPWIDGSTAPKLTWKFLRLLVDVVKQVFVAEVFRRVLSPDLAISLFASQLQRFLIQGRIAQLFEAEHLQEANTKVQMFHFVPGISAEKRLKGFTSGSMLLAAFCEATGKLEFLRNCVYLVLRFCDTDGYCLLAIISSIARVCSKSLLLAGRDDVVGQAVHVVTSELLHDVDAGEDSEASKSVRDTAEGQEVKMSGGQECSESGTDGSSDSIQFIGNLSVLRKIIGNEPDMNFEAYVPKLMNSIHELISATFGPHTSDKKHLLQKILRSTSCNKSWNSAPFAVAEGVETIPRACPGVAMPFSNDLSGSAGQIETEDGSGNGAEDYTWRFARNSRTEPCSSSQPLTNHSMEETSFPVEWERKFYDVSAALELIACQLGWEWTYNDLILEHLWKLVAPGAPAITVACVAYLFGLLGRLGREVDNTDLPGVDELRKFLSIVISPIAGGVTESGGGMHFSFTAQVAAAQSLLVLFGFNRTDLSAVVISAKDAESCFMERSDTKVECAKSLQNWVKASEREIREIWPLPLRYALLSVERYIPSSLR